MNNDILRLYKLIGPSNQNVNLFELFFNLKKKIRFYKGII